MDWNVMLQTTIRGTRGMASPMARRVTVPMAIAALSEKAGLSLALAISLVVIFSVLGLAVLVALGPEEVRARPAPEAAAH